VRRREKVIVALAGKLTAHLAHKETGELGDPRLAALSSGSTSGLSTPSGSDSRISVRRISALPGDVLTDSDHMHDRACAGRLR